MLENIYNLFVFIALFLDSIIYSLISWVYQIILVLCQVDILDNSYEITQLMNRLYIVIGIVVLFLLAYSLLKSMVNPDDALKNKKGPVAIIRDVIISIVLIALVPSIFSFAMGFQQSLLTQNTIGKLILGNSSIGGEPSETTIESGGIEIASNILQAFIHPANNECPYIVDEEGRGRFDCSEIEIATENAIGGIPIAGFLFSVDSGFVNYDAIWESIKDTGNFLGITTFAYSISHESVLSYYFIISTAVGIFVLLVLLSYCIDIAIRAVKLAVFQLIAPLPILARIMPNEQGGKVFSNWLKATLSTYLEVFIRLAILFFAVLLIKIVVQNLPTLLVVDDFLGGDASFTVYLFAQLFVIVGIILFIKQAPGIIKDITGLDGGKYKFFNGLKEGFGALKTGAAFVGGTIAGANPLAGYRAAKETNKSGNLASIGHEYMRRQAKLDAKREGATLSDRTTDRIRQAFGLGTKLEQANRNIDKGRDIRGNVQKVTNDTGEDIVLKDDTGRVIDTIKANDREVVMDEQRLNNLQHQKDLNKRAMSEIEEQIRQLKDLQAVNSKYIDIRSKIKSEAIDKIAEGDSSLTDELIYNGQKVASGNYKSLSDFYQSRINAGASQEELSELSRQLKSIQDKLWVQYANNEIAKGSSTKIGSLFQQGIDVYNATNGYYDASSNTFKGLDSSINIHNMEFFEGDGTNAGIDKLSKMNNSTLDINISRTESGKTPINEQNVQIDRLIAQLEELKAAAKTSPEYQKYKASDNANKISDNGKK